MCPIKAHWQCQKARNFKVRWDEEYGVTLSKLIYVLGIAPDLALPD